MCWILSGPMPAWASRRRILFFYCCQARSYAGHPLTLCLLGHDGHSAHLDRAPWWSIGRLVQALEGRVEAVAWPVLTLLPRLEDEALVLLHQGKTIPLVLW